ncbi:hypothetical protein MXB_137, partial [Myxobolus squamalis]
AKGHLHKKGCIYAHKYQPSTRLANFDTKSAGMNFKPILKLKNAMNAYDLSKDGAILEFESVDGPLEDDEETYQYDPMKYLEEEDEEQVDHPVISGKNEDITGDGGVIKILTKPGIGPIPTTNALCRVFKKSSLFRGELEPFDSTRLRNHGNGLQGLQIALSTMSKEEEAKFIIRSDYAYGQLGCPPRIPHNATIIFDVEMISFVNQDHEDATNNPDDNENRSWTRVFRKLEVLHKEANDCFKHNHYGKALGRYGKALRLAEKASLFSGEDEEQMNEFCVKMFLNVGLCSLKLKKYKYAISMCERVLSVQPNNLKATFRLGQAYRHSGDFNKSKQFLIHAKTIAPLNSDICDELFLLSRAFSEDPTTDKIVLPNFYLPTELSLLDKVADKYNMSVTHKVDTYFISILEQSNCFAEKELILNEYFYLNSS